MTVPTLPSVPGSTEELGWGDAMTWAEFEWLVHRSLAPFAGRFEQLAFEYVHPIRLQDHWPAHQRKPTPLRMAYTAWGDPDAPVLICAGGILNTSRRWDYLADRLARHFYVICPDWPGRGISAWLPTQGDYSVATNAEMLRQLLDHLECERASFIGASHGGTVCLALAADAPQRIDRLVLNDIGPFMAAENRQRRAQAVARHYVFRRPADLFRRLGLSARNEGAITEDQLLHNAYFQTEWSDGHGGRIYRHDPRALQAYAEEAGQALDQWTAWQQICGPVLVLHGLLSDALRPETVAAMLARPGTIAMHIPDTGHMPALACPNQIHFIEQWLTGQGAEAEFSCLNPPAGPRHLFAVSPV